MPRRLAAPLLVVLALLAPVAAPASAQTITVAIVEPETSVAELHEVLPEAALGLISPGLGRVAPAQALLDITQGARTWTSLYPDPLPFTEPDAPVLDRRLPAPEGGMGGARGFDRGPLPAPDWWAAARDRAEGAPARLIPGLLAEVAREGGVDVVFRGPCCEEGDAEIAALARDRAGRLEPTAGPRRPRIEVIRTQVRVLPALLAGSAGVIAMPFPSDPMPSGLLPVAIWGIGLSGTLTSPSTRIEGYVLTTDLAPTMLDSLGLEVPDEMDGTVVDSTGTADVASLVSLERRLAEVGPRRGQVAGLAVLVWLALAAAALAVGRGDRRLLALLALSCLYLPLLALVGAALDPSRAVEVLVVGAGGPLLGLATLRRFPGWQAAAVACWATIAAHAVDLVGGSELIARSVLGPNPAIGARFYGIGNELEATFAVLVPLAVGASIAGWRPRLSVRGAAWAFGLAGAAATLVFATGALGAAVGAAIVLPVGAVAAAIAYAWPVRRTWLLTIPGVPAVAVLLLAAIDLVSGGDAHLTRSVLEAGGAEGMAETAERRLRLAARSFARPEYIPFWLILAGALAAAWTGRRTVALWLSARPVRAIAAGGMAATLVGAVANDSGALLLLFGAGWLAVAAAFCAWAEGPGSRAASPGPGTG